MSHQVIYPIVDALLLFVCQANGSEGYSLLFTLPLASSAEEEKPTDAQQEAFALLQTAPQRAAAAEVLSKVLHNIVDHPTEAKFR